MDISDFLRKNKLLSIFGAIVAVAAIIFLSYILSTASTSVVPAAFNDARVSASIYAADLVARIAQTTGRMDEIEKLVKEGWKSNALSIVMEEIKKNNELREIATQLSVQLEKMVEEIEYIQSDEAQYVAFNATTKEAELIAELIEYTEELEDLLKDLSFAVTQQYPDYTDVNDSISDINEIAEKVNVLNDEYMQAMKEFDRIVEAEQNK